MPVYHDEKTNKWFVMTRYTDWHGERKQKCKKGFKTKREATEWERIFQLQQSANLNMTFEAFYELYESDQRPRLKENTWFSKEHLIKKKILPYFAKKRMNEITARDIIQWQNEMLKLKGKNNKPYSQTYLKTIGNQLSAIFNHAVKNYGLTTNPVAHVSSIGCKEAGEMLFWTKNEYLKFAEAAMDKPQMYYAYEMLYWCGIREGELLALTPADLDFKKNTVSVTKSYQRLKGNDIITSPKTKQSIRTVKMPDFLAEEMKDYLKMLYDIKPNDRMFQLSKSQLTHDIDRYSKIAGVKRIRVHDLRHSHVSLLIDMGFSAVAIAKRVGHKSIDITFRYAHLFPSKQDEMANKLNLERTEKNVS